MTARGRVVIGQGVRTFGRSFGKGSSARAMGGWTTTHSPRTGLPCRVEQNACSDGGRRTAPEPLPPDIPFDSKKDASCQGGYALVRSLAPARHESEVNVTSCMALGEPRARVSSGHRSMPGCPAGVRHGRTGRCSSSADVCAIGGSVRRGLGQCRRPPVGTERPLRAASRSTNLPCGTTRSDAAKRGHPDRALPGLTPAAARSRLEPTRDLETRTGGLPAGPRSL